MNVLLTALNAHYMHTSLSVRQLRAACRKLDGINTEICEMHINLPYRRALNDIVRRKSDVIGFSCYIWNISYVLRLCRAIKLALPGCIIVLGGPEVAHDAPRVLSENDCIDAVLSGEGEQVLPEYLAALRDSRKVIGIAGVSARNKQGEIIVMPPPAPMEVCEWVDAYAEGAKEIANRLVYIETSRGCPYACQYCLSSSGEKVRALPAAEAVRRLTALAEDGVKIIKLVDRTFNFNRSRAKEIWRALIDHAKRTGIKSTYHFELAANLLDAESIDILSSAPEGLFQIEAGIQSANDQVLKNIGRSVPFEPVRQAVMAVRQAGNIHLHTDLIAGLPGEDMASFEKSFDAAFELGAQMLQLGFLKLLKGSGLRKNAENLGIVYEPDAPYEVISTREMSFDDLCFLKDVEEMLEWYHNSGRYPSALKFLLEHKKPFGLFADLARRCRAEGRMESGQGERARAQLLLDAGSEFADGNMLAALIRHDLLTQGRRTELPEALRFKENREEWNLLREHFHPVRGQSAYTYDFDVSAYLDGRGIVRGSFTVIYK